MSQQYPTLGIQNAQRQSQQFLLTQKYEQAISNIDVYPSVNAASNESIASLQAMFGQSAPNKPSRIDNSPLDPTLRQDRPSLATLRASMHQNPFTVPSRGESDFNETLFTGGNVDFLMDLEESADMPDRGNTAPSVGTGIQAQSEMLFMGGDNQARSDVKARKKSVVGDIVIPHSMDYKKYQMDRD